MEDENIEEILKRRLEQEKRFSGLEGRMTAVESCTDEIKHNVKEIHVSIGEAKDAFIKWLLGVVVTLAIFGAGIIWAVASHSPKVG